MPQTGHVSSGVGAGSVTNWADARSVCGVKEAASSAADADVKINERRSKPGEARLQVLHIAYLVKVKEFNAQANYFRPAAPPGRSLL
jgi:hypothetical protein